WQQASQNQRFVKCCFRETLLSGDFKLHIDTQGSDLFQQYIKRLRHTRLHAVIAIHDVFVHLGSACHVVRLDCQHFLQCVRSTVCYQCPHLHLTETLTTELGFTTQRLLGNKTVRTG